MTAGGSRLGAALGGSLLTILLAAGCGGSVESVESDGLPVPFEQYEAEFASAICNTYAGVCGRAGLAHNYAACVDSFAPKINGATQLDPTHYDPALARHCIDSVANSASSGLLEDLWPAEVLALCRPLFAQGRTIAEAIEAIPAALGEACDTTCSDTSCRAYKGERPPHVCLWRQGLVCSDELTCEPAKRAGEACVKDNYSCTEGLNCLEQRCIEPHSTGPCENHAYCTGTSECHDGQCVPKHLKHAEFCAGDFEATGS